MPMGTMRSPATSARPSSCRSSGCWPGSGRWCPAARPARRRGCARELVDARIDATVGFADVATLSACRNRSISAGEGADRRSARDDLEQLGPPTREKCSHNALECSTPSASKQLLEQRARRTPHDVPALVAHFSNGGHVRGSRSAIASVRSPFVTLLHEQICAA